jgi:hypothetical protein
MLFEDLLGLVLVDFQRGSGEGVFLTS